MARELVPQGLLSDEGADLDVLAHDFFPARPVAQDEIVEERLVEGLLDTLQGMATGG